MVFYLLFSPLMLAGFQLCNPVSLSSEFPGLTYEEVSVWLMVNSPTFNLVEHLLFLWQYSGKVTLDLPFLFIFLGK